MKTSIFSSTLCFYVILFQIWNGKPLAFKPIFGQKTSILTKLLYFGSIKSIRCHYFQMFFEKNQRFHAHILSKNYLFSKTILFLCPYFVKKTSILTKKHCSHITFSNFDMKNLLLSHPH